MNENLSMNQSKMEDAMSMRPIFLFIISSFFAQCSVLSVLKNGLTKSSHYPYSLT
jgi:hypothetical protein